MNCLSPLIFRKKCFLTNLWLRFCLSYRPFSKYMCWVHAQPLSCFLLFATLWTVACQAPLSIEFSRQAYWSGLTFPSPGIFLTQGSNPHLLHWQVDSLSWAPWEALSKDVYMCVHVLSHVRLFPTPIDCSPPGSSVLGTFHKRYLPFPCPRNLPDPGIESASLMSPTFGRWVLYQLSYQGPHQ